MARRRGTDNPARTRVRDGLTAHYRDMAARYGRIVPEFVWREHWTERADKLDRGEPLIVAGWEIASHDRGRRWTAVPWVRVEPDGVLTPVSRDELGYG